MENKNSIKENISKNKSFYENTRKNVSGITLVALVVTIIILIILAGVSVAMILGENGLIAKAKEAKRDTTMAFVIEQAQMDISAEQAGASGEITKGKLDEILSKYDKDGQVKIDEEGEEYIETKEGHEIKVSDIWTGTTTVTIDGSWTGKVNSPKIEGTGLTAVYWDETNSEWVKLTEKSSKEEWAKWYSYTETDKKWANAQSKDGSMWVWIPRYEYLLDSANKKITVRFISTETDKNTSGYTTDETGITTSSDNYIIHPAFTADVNNGGWTSELPGFWVAKYAAGFQNSTVAEAAKTVEYSPNLKYTELNGYKSNFLEQTITANTTKLSYPVFKANTYAYNIISIADAWLLAQEIDSANMYGLSNVDSHLQKNSEWGAVAYLTHSQYGVNGNSSAMNEIAMNNKNLNNTIYVNNATSGTKGNVYGVTSYGSSNTPNDVTASSTQNMTGVFDLRGCVWERTAGFYKGGAADTPEWHNAMASSSTTESSKYITLYTANNKKGDATNETSDWNSDNAYFVTSRAPVFSRGGYYDNAETDTGVFAFYASYGSVIINVGFRVCLAF